MSNSYLMLRQEEDSHAGSPYGASCSSLVAVRTALQGAQIAQVADTLICITYA